MIFTFAFRGKVFYQLKASHTNEQKFHSSVLVLKRSIPKYESDCCRCGTKNVSSEVEQVATDADLIVILSDFLSL